MLNIRSFKVTDIRNISLRKEQSELLLAIDNFDQYGIIISNTYNPITVELNNKIILIGGIMRLLPHSGEGYFLIGDTFTEAFKSHGKSLIKGIRRYIQDSPFKRISTYVREDFPEAQKFIEVLGFRKEGLMNKVTADIQNAFLYAMVR